MSSLNKLIANVQRTSDNLQITNFYNDEKLVTIDSLNNRIGINQLHPKHAIDISYRTDIDRFDMAINTPYLIVNHHADFKLDMSCVNADISSLTVQEFTTNKIKIENVDLSSIKSDIGDITSITSNNITNNNNITTKNLFCEQDASINKLIIPNDGNIECNGKFTASNRLEIKSEAEFICHSGASFTVSGQLQYGSLKKITIPGETNNSTIFDKVDISHLDVSYLKVTDEISANVITCESLTTDSLVFNANLDINRLRIIGSISNLEYNYNITGADSIDCSTITTRETISTDSNLTNVTIDGKLNCKNTHNGIFLPDYDTGISSQTISGNNQLYFDNHNDVLKIYSNISEKYETCLTRQRWCRLSLNEISGNITDSNNTIQDVSNIIIQDTSAHYKYIPLNIHDTNDLSLNIFSITYNDDLTSMSNNRTQYLKIEDLGHVYQIDATISLQFLNKFPGDVEVTHYEFIIYFHDITHDNIELDANNHPSVKNQIFSIDTSFNYASSTINWIGKLKLTENNIYFLIKSTSLENLQQLRIDSFNCVVKCIE